MAYDKALGSISLIKVAISLNCVHELCGRHLPKNILYSVNVQTMSTRPVFGDVAMLWPVDIVLE